MSDRMGELAALDVLPDVGAPLVGDGGQFSPGLPAVNRVAERLPSAMMGGLAQMVQTPGALMSENPYPPGSEMATWYDAQKVAAANEWAPGMALNMMGGGVAGTGKVRPNEIDLTAGYDPKLWHGVSTIKLPKPVDEMSSVLRPVNPAQELVASPARFQNSLLMPLLGDRTATAAMLERVNGYQFENPVSLEGGHGYMANNPGMAWAAGKSIAPGIGRVAREGAESGVPVHGVYTAMGERSADFSHMMSDTLAEMAKHTKITPKGAELFNETMRKVSPDFPGIHDPNVAQYLRDAPGAVRNVFAKTMDTSPMQKHGFPSVAEARVAVTDPRLLNEPTGAAGLSIARMDPGGKLGPSGHGTYDTGIRGDYVAGLPASVPKEVMFPDVMGALSKHADAVAQARVDAGLKPFRPTEDYLMSRSPKGLPKFQEANQKWVDSVSKHLEDRGFTLGSGATDKKMGAILAATDNQPTGIKAYHSSPHDFDKFDLSKIGTGEGAQAYGHGLYFAENPVVSGQGGQYWRQFLEKFEGPEALAARKLQALNFDREATAQAMRKSAGDVEIRSGDSPYDIAVARGVIKQREDALRLLESDKPVGPRTYEVNINADPAHMLDWDKALTEQHPQVQSAIERYVRAKSGEDQIWRTLGGEEINLSKMTPEERRVNERLIPKLGGQAMPAWQHDLMRESPATLAKPAQGDAALVSQRLSEAGIPGIKYLDQGSRRADPTQVKQWQRMLDATADPVRRAALQAKFDAAGMKPTSNYVIFDPNLIRIDKKYALPIATGAGMGALAAQDQYQP